MKITDFKEFIKEIPYLYQSFDINKSVWMNGVNQIELISQIFGEVETISISRFDLFRSNQNLEELVIKVLMWGYPTKGRGKNIENLLLPENFNLFLNKLQLLEEKTNLDLLDIQDLTKIKGLGLSTLSKILYFKKMKIESYPAMILDQRVINAINAQTKFEDAGIEKFKTLTYEKGTIQFVDYLAFLNELAIKMKVLPDQIEMFLFEFGTTLKEPIGELGDWNKLK